MSILSIAASSVPFLNSCDTTRLQMISKYFSGQVLPYEKNEYPKLIPYDIYNVSIYTDGRFIKFADDDGKVLYKDELILIVYYQNLDKFEIYDIPEYKKTNSIFATKLRYVIDKETFKKGDLLFEYTGFINGIPAPGFNARVMFHTFNMFNHEDAIVVSESFAKKFKFYSMEELYIPIYVDTKLIKNSQGKFLPDLGDKFNENDDIIVVRNKNIEITENLFNTLVGISMNKSQFDTSFKLTNYKGVVSNIEIFKVSDKIVNDYNTGKLLSKLWAKHNDKVKIAEEKLKNVFNSSEYVKSIIQNFYKIKKSKTKVIPNVNDLVYIIKLTLTYEEDLLIGDKLTTRGANKGVISKIIPDELMPVDQFGNKIDVIISPFAIPSRMNINQIYEMYLADLVSYAEKLLIDREYKIAFNLILDICSKFGKRFYDQTKKFIDLLSNDTNLLNTFTEEVKKNGLFIVVDNFKDKDVSKTDILEIYKKYNYPTKKKVKFSPRKLKKYLTNIDDNFLPEETEIEVFVGSMYIYRLFKIARYLMNARSVGPYHSILRIPTRGKANQGGCRIGNNEIDMLLTYDSKYILHEFITIKADDHEGKKQFLDSLIQYGKYNLSKSRNSFVLLTVDSLLKTLFVDISSKIKLKEDKNDT